MIYIFWTGGYDSTFRLCQLLIKYKKKVQPIYISDPNLDNFENKKTKRKNHKNEIEAMIKIRNLLYYKFNFIQKLNLLMPLIIIKKVNYDNDIRKNMIILKDKKYVRRSQCQYGGMAQICKNLEKKIELCAEVGGFFEKKLKNKIYCDKKNCYIKHFSNSDRCLSIFNLFLLPLINYTKEEMYKESVIYKFNTILNTTWSCWYPRNNKPCKRCDMCRNRLKILESNKQIIEEFQIKDIIKNNNRIHHNKQVMIIISVVLYMICYIMSNY